MTENPAAALSDLRLHGAGRVDCRPSWGMAEHLHPFHEIIYIIHGSYRAVVGGEVLRAGPGDALLYRAGVPHEESSGPEDPAQTVYVCFECAGVTEGWPNVTRDRRGRIGRLMQWLHEDREDPSPGSLDPREAALRLLLTEIARAPAEQDQQFLHRVHRFFTERLSEPITLEETAQAVGLSKYHFLRRYRSLSGRTPMDDLRRLRIDHARNLILTTGLPLKAVAPLAGLGDQHHMTRLFRRYLGMTPGEMRRRVSPRG